jgi:hypothetical protein
MKNKVLGLFALVCGLMAGASALAADGYVYEIIPCDALGNKISAPASLANPVGSGHQFYFNMRLIEQTSNAKDPWVLTYTGFGSEAVDWAVSPLEVGLFVSGQGPKEGRKAKLVDCKTRDTGRYVYTDLIFMYQTKPGDFALPIRLAVVDSEGNPVPATDDRVDGRAYFFNNLGYPWAFKNNNGATCNFEYAAAVAGTGSGPDGIRVLDYSLEKCGFYVKTLDFDQNWESTDYWREVHENSTKTISMDPKIIATTALADATNGLATTLYVWSMNENAVRLKNGIEKEIKMSAAGAVVTARVHEIKFEAGDESVNFAIEGVTSNETANLVLSAWDNFSYMSGSKERRKDFITVPVRCREPLPPQVEVQSDKLTVQANENYLLSVTRLTVSLSQPYDASPLVVDVKASFKNTNIQSNISDYVRLSTSSDDFTLNGTLPNDTEVKVTFPKGKTDPQTIYVFALRSENGVTTGIDNQILFTPSTEDAAANQVINDWNPAGIYIAAEKPKIIAPAEGASISAIVGEPKELELEVADVFADMKSDVGYKIYVRYKDSEGEKELDGNYKPDAAGILKKVGTNSYPLLTYTTSGEYVTEIQIKSPISGQESEVRRINAKIDPARTTEVYNTDGNEDRLYNEGDTVRVKIKLSAVNDTGAPLYAFLVPSEDIENPDEVFYGRTSLQRFIIGMDNCTGLEIPADNLESQEGNFKLLDGWEDYGFNAAFTVVISRNKQYTKAFDKSDFEKGYNSNAFSISVNNVEPVIEYIDMNNGDLSEHDGFVYPGAIPKGQIQKFSAYISDIDYDLRTNFAYRVNIKGPGITSNATYEVSKGFDKNADIHNFDFEYNFPLAGDYSIKVSVLDKDMSNWAKAPNYTVHLSVLNNPVVTVTPLYESVKETETKATVAIALGYYDSINPLVAKVTVIPPSATDPAEKTGTLIFDSDYKVIPPQEENPVPYPPLAENEYYVVLSSTTPVNLLATTLDGTDLSSGKGFKIKAEIVSEFINPKTQQPWKDYYLPSSSTMYVENVSPNKGDETITFNPAPNTNAWRVAGGRAEGYPLRVTIRSDVEPDMENGITVTIIGGGAENYNTDGWNKGVKSFTDSTTIDFVPDFTGLSKEQSVTIIVEDKDGGLMSRTWLYDVQASKFLKTIATGPSGGVSTSALSKKYSFAKGLGEGHTFVSGATMSSAQAFHLTWNCGLSVSATIAAFGYRQGAVDNGTLNNNLDVAIDSAGNYSGLAITDYYTYNDEKELDSFFYCWIYSTIGDDNKNSSSILGDVIMPEKPKEVAANKFAFGSVNLPTQALQDGTGYADTTVEAIFSREFLKEDNAGDINYDGIPDVYAHATWGSGNLIELTTGGTVLDADITDIAKGNPDEDLLPGVFEQEGEGEALGNVLKNSYAPVGLPLTNYRELRGFHEGLNANDKFVASTPSFSEDEQAAWEAYAAANGLDPAAPDLSVWSPEPSGQFERMDPTMEDTDSDGMPDGWEYYFWYMAKVWAPAGAKAASPKKGQRYTFERFNTADYLRGVEIPAEEVLARYNPCEALGDDVFKEMPDFDGDGLSDLEELVIGTNPTHWDSDGDHMADGWEVMMALDPINGGDKTSNPDGDFMAYFDTFGLFSVEEGGKFYVDMNNELVLGLDYDFDGTAFVTLRDVSFTALAITPKMNADGTPFTYGLTFDEEGGDITKIPEVWHWGYRMAEETEVTTHTLPAGTELTQMIGPDVFVFIHDQVKGIFGFDPRTGWYANGDGYLADRWNPTINTDLSPFDVTGLSVNTQPYTTYDEYLLMLYRLNGGPVFPDDANPDFGKAMFDTLGNYTTVPTITVAQITDVESDSDTSTTNETVTTVTAEVLAKALAEAGSSKMVVRCHGADTDSDGMPDGWEMYLPRNPNSAPNKKSELDGLIDPWDIDEDLLGVVDEFAGTDSCNAYKSCASIYENHPGIKTGWYNKFFPTDPDDPDTDADGIVDSQEGATFLTIFPYGGMAYGPLEMSFVYGTPEDSITCCVRGGGMNPCTVDTDIDGLPDLWEMSYCGVTVGLGTKQYVPPRDAESGADIEIPFEASTWIADGHMSEDFSPSGSNIVYIVGGQDPTWGGDAWTDPNDEGNSYDELLGAVRDVDWDHDGLQNYQEYLVQQVRHFRYDDITTPLMGREFKEGAYTPDGSTLIGTHAQRFVGYVPMMQDPTRFAATTATIWGENTAVSVTTNLVDLQTITNTASGAIHQKEVFEVVTNIINGAGLVSDHVYGGNGVTFAFSYPWTQQGWAALGYMSMPVHGWDRLITSSMIPPYFMLPPTGAAYVSTDPRVSDTDADGMDDYYEMFHGLNPLLGSSLPQDAMLQDIIAISYGAPDCFNAFWNEWTHNDYNRYTGVIMQMPQASSQPLSSAAAMDPVKYPWVTGGNDADPDGDGIRNDHERIEVNTTSPQSYHTDPTPAWFTDTSSPSSYASQYYRLTAPVSDMPFWPLMPGFDDPYSEASAAGWNVNYLFSFEEDEGYDTDNDWVPDNREITSTFRSMTDPLVFSDPSRRQALYLDGSAGSFAMTRTSQLRGVDAVDILKQFSVEAWVYLEKTGAQTIIDRSTLYAYSSNIKDNGAYRSNFRIGTHSDGRVYGMFDNDDAIESGANSSISCQTVSGPVLELRKWTHLALTYDGKTLKLFINGQCDGYTVNTSLIPANGVFNATQDPVWSNGLASAYKALPSTLYIGARPKSFAEAGDSAILPDTVKADSMREYFKGYIDEVRIWDGARDATAIKGDMYKRYNFAMANENRELLYKQIGGEEPEYSRNDNDGLKNADPELIQHFDFSTLPSAVEGANVSTSPMGFNNQVQGQSPSLDINIGWWSRLDPSVKHKYYTDTRVVPWIENTVSHLPITDGSVLDSYIFSSTLGGYYMPASGHSLEKYTLANSANPYHFWNYYYDRHQRLFLLNRIAEAMPEACEDVLYRYRFDIRTRFLGTSDLIPLGGAFAKVMPKMWDGHVSDAWEQTGADTDGDGLPDWWETLAGGDATSTEWTGLVDYNGEKMPAWMAYLFGISSGLQPGASSITDVNKSYMASVDADGDNLPDWWERVYGIEAAKGADDSDADGLSNYIEYFLSEVINSGARFSPVNAKSVNRYIPDAFHKVGEVNVGTIFTDHDRVRDTWEDLYDNDQVNRYVYDSEGERGDPDADGWSNFAEFQAGTDPTKVGSLGIDAIQINEYPVPTIEAKITYDGEQNIIDKPVIIKAWRDLTLNTKHDAQWTIGGGVVNQYEGGASNIVTGTKYIGMNPGKEMLLHLSPGSVVAGSVKFEFKDLSWYLVDLTTYSAVSFDPATAIWTGTIIDKQDPKNLARGDIVSQLDTTQVLGSIDYATGAVTIDFAKLDEFLAIVGDISGTYQGDQYVSIYTLAQCYVRVNWHSKPIEGTTTGTYYLSDADRPSEENNSVGHVKEGLNIFTAFVDLDGDGQYSAGEPYGTAPNVDVNWNYAKFNITLTDTHPVIARFAAGTVENSDSTTSGTESGGVNNDREEIYGSESGNVPIENITVGKPSGAGYERVRIVRTMIDGIDCTLYNVPSRVVFDKWIYLPNRRYITEADIYAAGAMDIDWTYLADDLKGADTTFVCSQVTYRVVLGNGSVSNSTTNNLLGFAFNRAFDAAEVFNLAKPCNLTGGTMLSTRPRVSWAIPAGLNSYTTCKIEIRGVDNDFSWVSNEIRMPTGVKDSEISNLRYTLDVPLYVGDKVGGKVFENGKKYKWSVAIHNSRYREDNWSDWCNFTMSVPTNSADYGSIRAAVKYFGPKSAVKGTVRVHAFSTPDFSGEPVSVGYVADIESLTATNAAPVENARIIGLKAGSYYLKAFIDQNDNGKCDKLESWGFLCQRDDVDASIYAVKSVTIGPGTGIQEIIPIYIEDCDLDRDNLPDAWEVAMNGTIDALGTEKLDDDIAGIKINSALAEAIAGQEAKGYMSSGLSSLMTSSLRSSGMQTLMLSVPVASGQSPNQALQQALNTTTVDENSVVITAFKVADDGTITISYEAGTTASGLDGSSIALSWYDISATGSVTADIYVQYTPNLAQAWSGNILVASDVTISADGAEQTLNINNALKNAGYDVGNAGFYKLVISNIR